jgi:Arm DNA-binding domain
VSPNCEREPQTFSAKGTFVRQILTDALCRTKPPSAGRLEIADLRQAGLVLRITSNGARSFAYRFRHPHSRKTLRATIGPYPATPLEAARKRAKEMAAQVADGANPIEARNAQREAAPTRTFQALADRYLKEHAEHHKRPRSAEEDRRNLAVHVLPRWAKRDFRAIRRADVIEVIESIVTAGKHAAGNRVHSLISKIFGRTSTERRSRSCASPQSASCSENSAIRPKLSGQTLRTSGIPESKEAIAVDTRKAEERLFELLAAHAFNRIAPKAVYPSHGAHLRTSLDAVSACGN